MSFSPLSIEMKVKIFFFEKKEKEHVLYVLFDLKIVLVINIHIVLGHGLVVQDEF